MAEAKQAWPGVPHQFAPGSRLGRYLILEPLGAGGMGWVFLAFDPELDRKVAIKVLRTDRRRNQQQTTRLIREAQAMARLAHPNVVTVHDVGTWDQQLFVTMEYVRGMTLTKWLEPPRDWPAIVAVFVDAGRGLAAAHAAGLIHRDFKPDNVLVGDDGRARVMDFGLVRADASEERDALDAPDDELASVPSDSLVTEVFELGASGSSVLSQPLTRVGALLGTPRYMAPEQFKRQPTDHRTDQFSFCVALYEALWGQRPFSGTDLASIQRGLLERHRPARPSDRRVPAWLDAIVERGLGSDPASRWPSMDALVDALRHDPTARRRRTLASLSLVAFASALLGALAAVDRYQTNATIAACKAERSQVGAVWNPEQADRLERAFLATEQPGAANAWQGTKPWLDAYAEQLGERREANCLANRVDQTRDDDDAALVRACLDEGQARFEVLVDVLAEGHAGMSSQAAPAAANLPHLAECDDLRRQAAIIRPPAGLHEAIVDLDRSIHRAEALWRVDEFDAARRMAEAAALEADVLDWPPAHARAQLVLARLSLDAGQVGAAQAGAELAFRKAAIAGDRMLMIEAAHMIAVAAENHSDNALADVWADTADELIAGAGLESSLLAARVDVLRARTDIERGKLAEAEAHARAAMAIVEARLGPDHPALGSALIILSSVLLARDETQRAAEVAERHLAIDARAYGPDSANLINTYNNFGATMQSAGDHAAARDYYERGIVIAERVFGPDHYQLAAPTANLGLLALDEGDLETARRYFERATAIFERVEGERSTTLIRPLVNLGTIASRQGRHDDALAHFERCEAILAGVQEERFDQRETFVRASHADALVRKGDLAAAYPHYERALAVVEALHGPSHPQALRPLLGLAGIDVERGAIAAAEAKLDRAATLVDAEPTRRWAYEFVRARLAWARGEREAALAQLALVRASQAGPRPDSPYAVAEIDAWLANHP